MQSVPFSKLYAWSNHGTLSIRRKGCGLQSNYRWKAAIVKNRKAWIFLDWWHYFVILGVYRKLKTRWWNFELQNRFSHPWNAVLQKVGDRSPALNNMAESTNLLCSHIAIAKSTFWDYRGSLFQDWQCGILCISNIVPFVHITSSTIWSSPQAPLCTAVIFHYLRLSYKSWNVVSIYTVRICRLQKH